MNWEKTPKHFLLLQAFYQGFNTKVFKYKKVGHFDLILLAIILKNAAKTWNLGTFSITVPSSLVAVSPTNNES